ncbi:formate dehydrogenase subunit gamma [Rhodovulum sp. DZ06]|uniref:formate dehydrogenase subunit gamma n=1 Tax=Rhodovulum sp. DZ06 TaxID=3425126 RepID=UPI003D33D161
MSHPDRQPEAAEIQAIIDARLSLEGPLLPILHDLQAAFGHIPEEAVTLAAAALNLTRAEVHGVVSFYHDFRKAPAGRKVLKICRAESCQSVGGAAIAEAALAKLGVDWHETTPDGAVTVEPVYCLGLCANGPAAMLGDKPVARLDDEARLAALLKEARA